MNWHCLNKHKNESFITTLSNGSCDLEGNSYNVFTLFKESRHANGLVYAIFPSSSSKYFVAINLPLVRFLKLYEWELHHENCQESWEVTRSRDRGRAVIGLRLRLEGGRCQLRENLQTTRTSSRQHPATIPGQASSSLLTNEIGTKIHCFTSLIITAEKNYNWWVLGYLKKYNQIVSTIMMPNSKF